MKKEKTKPKKTFQMREWKLREKRITLIRES